MIYTDKRQIRIFWCIQFILTSKFIIMKICNQCQAVNSDEAKFCSKCGAQLGFSQYGSPQQGYQSQQQQPNPQYQQAYQQQKPNMPKPDNNIVLAILTTLFCCLPLGIVSIIYASKVNGLYNSGDYHGAIEAANSAKNYAMYSVICGAVAFVFYFILGFMEGIG